MMLFGDAYSRFWQLPEGAVLAVDTPKLMPPRDSGDAQKQDATLSVFGGEQIMKLGMARYMGRCRGTKKTDGSPCNAIINTYACACSRGGLICSFQAYDAIL